MTRFGHKLNYVINTFVKHTPGPIGLQTRREVRLYRILMLYIKHLVGGFSYITLTTDIALIPDHGLGSF